MYKVELSGVAAEFYGRADRPLAGKLKRCFEQLSRDPVNHSMIRKLCGDLEGYRRYRIGDYRVVYSVDHASETVSVVTIVHRSDAYE